MYFFKQCLRKDAESHRRELHIRTYAVIPLNDECGIIEWVNNTAGLRPILTKLYKEKGIKMNSYDTNIYNMGIEAVNIYNVGIIVNICHCTFF